MVFLLERGDMMLSNYKHIARYEWGQARRKAFWSRFQARLTYNPRPLLSFDEVARIFQLRTPLYRGVQTIPLARIVGSVGRCQDFFQTFLPANEALQQRWQSVARLYLDPECTGAPPIELFQVGDAYFVKDGNHRVSVANQLGLTDIEAYVWQYPELVVGLAGTGNLEAVLLETERHAFLAQTHLDEIALADTMRLTVPGGFEIMRGQIVYYQYILSQIDGQEISYTEAARAWYRLIFQSLIQVVEEAGLPALWPERTPADLSIWLIRHQRELAAQSQKRVLMTEAATDLERGYRPHVPLCLWRLYRCWLRRTGRLKLPEIIAPAFPTG
jgi:hypothetical protein